MRLLLSGFNHHNSPFPLLGLVALAPDAAVDVLRRFQSRADIAEVACLATCNRTEFVCLAADPDAAHTCILGEMAARTGVPVDELAPHALKMTDDAAMEHLLRVASGIDSMIVGEWEILGQLRRALEQAEGLGTAGQGLRRVVGEAVRFGRRMRHETRISRGSLSVAAVGARLAKEALGGLSGATALVIGAGEMGQQSLRALRNEGCLQLRLSSRCAKRAQTLADATGATVVPMENLPAALAACDVAVCATTSPSDIITAEVAGKAAAIHPKPRIYLDLAAPRNIDPAVGAVAGATLLRLEHMQEIARQNADNRRAEIATVERLIRIELENQRAQTAAWPRRELVSEIRSSLEDVRRRHFERTTSHHPLHLRQEIDAHSRSLLNALLHDLTARLNALDPARPDDRATLAAARHLLTGAPRAPVPSINAPDGNVIELDPAAPPQIRSLPAKPAAQAS